MLWFPQVKIATLMEAIVDPSTGAKKWWLGALDDVKLITAWSKRPDKPFIETQMKVTVSNSPVAAQSRYEEKVAEKIGKGYKLITKWEGGLWQIFQPLSNILPVFIPDSLALVQPAKGESIGRVRMIGKITDPVANETVLLEIFRGNDIFTGTEFCRIDHYEYGKNDDQSFPFYQTVYTNPTATIEAIGNTVTRRLDKGYMIEERDIGRIEAAFMPFMSFPLLRPDTPMAIAWDF